MTINKAIDNLIVICYNHIGARAIIPSNSPFYLAPNCFTTFFAHSSGLFPELYFYTTYTGASVKILHFKCKNITFYPILHKISPILHKILQYTYILIKWNCLKRRRERGQQNMSTLQELQQESLKALKQFYKADNVATKRIACDKLNLIIFKTANTFKCSLIEAQKLLKLED